MISSLRQALRGGLLVAVLLAPQASQAQPQSAPAEGGPAYREQHRLMMTALFPDAFVRPRKEADWNLGFPMAGVQLGFQLTRWAALIASVAGLPACSGMCATWAVEIGGRLYFGAFEDWWPYVSLVAGHLTVDSDEGHDDAGWYAGARIAAELRVWRGLMLTGEFGAAYMRWTELETRNLAVLMLRLGIGYRF